MAVRDNETLKSVSSNILNLGPDGLEVENGEVYLKRRFASKPAANEAQAVLESIDWYIGPDFLRKASVTKKVDGMYRVKLLNFPQWANTTPELAQAAHIPERLPLAIKNDDIFKSENTEIFSEFKSKIGRIKFGNNNRTVALNENNILSLTFNSEKEVKSFINDITYNPETRSQNTFATPQDIGSGEYKVKIDPTSYRLSSIPTDTVVSKIESYTQGLVTRSRIGQGHTANFLTRINNTSDQNTSKLTFKFGEYGNTIITTTLAAQELTGVVSQLNAAVPGYAKIKNNQIILNDLAWEENKITPATITAETFANIRRTIDLASTAKHNPTPATTTPAAAPAPATTQTAPAAAPATTTPAAAPAAAATTQTAPAPADATTAEHLALLNNSAIFKTRYFTAQWKAAKDKSGSNVYIVDKDFDTKDAAEAAVKELNEDYGQRGLFAVTTVGKKSYIATSPHRLQENEHAAKIQAADEQFIAHSTYESPPETPPAANKNEKKSPPPPAKPNFMTSNMGTMIGGGIGILAMLLGFVDPIIGLLIAAVGAVIGSTQDGENSLLGSFTSGLFGGGKTLNGLDLNKSKSLDAGELAAGLDKNKDGKLDVAELKALASAERTKLFALVGKTNDTEIDLNSIRAPLSLPQPAAGHSPGAAK